jgi:hypothetical protein
MTSEQMTAKEIELMPAGRPLDELAAQYVMGITPRDVRVKASGTDYVQVFNQSVYDGQWTMDELFRHGAPRPYSTDISAAMELVPMMPGASVRLHIIAEHAVHGGPERFAYHACIAKSAWAPTGAMAGGPGITWASADSAALALTRCAVLACLSLKQPKD